MLRYIVIFIFTLFVASCGDGKIYDTSAFFPDDEIKDNTTPEAEVTGLLNISEGSFNVEPYSQGEYNVLIFNTPIVASDSVSEKSNYSVSSNNSTQVNPTPKYKFASDESHIYDKNLFHYNLREKERLLLSLKDDGKKFVRRSKGPSNISVGYVWNNVKVSRGLSTSVEVISAECIAISDKGYFFLEQGVSKPSQDIIDKYTKAFDEIYPIMQDKFGKENDVDSNGKIIILFYNATVDGLYGYFYSADKKSVNIASDSNEADILYVNSNKIDSVDDVIATMAHELQHMISFDIRDNNNLNALNIWLDEGLSMQAEYFSGYYDKQSSDYLGQFLKDYYGYSLTQWDNNSNVNYGYSMAYVRYITDRFGDDVVKKIIHSQYDGVKAVEEATNTGFNDLFKDFALAMLISGRNKSVDDRYNFKTLDIVGKGGLSAKQSVSAGSQISTNVLPYGLNLLRFTGQVNSLNITGSVKGYGIAY